MNLYRFNKEEFKIPEDVMELMNKLIENDYKVYVVGGCVRDTMLGREPKDWDLTTDAKPEEMMKVFKDYKVIPTGLKHGTITIMVNDVGYEITTFRIDGNYSDNRHPDEVTFTNEITEDLARRDFTINAMAFNWIDGLIDPFGGIKDLQHGFIRTVGSADCRFKEDPLRMLRAFRFASKYEFQFSEDLLTTIQNNSGLIQFVSKERIRDELVKIVTDLTSVYYMRLLWESMLFDYTIPTIDLMHNFEQNNPYHTFDLFVHTMHSVRYIENDPILRMAMLLHDIGKLTTKKDDEQGISHYYNHASVSAKEAENILRDLKFDNKSIKRITTLIKIHDIQLSFENPKKQIKRALTKYGESIMKDLMKVKRADIKAQNPSIEYSRLQKLDEYEKALNEVLESREPFTIKDLAIDGKDVMRVLNLKEGKLVGAALRHLLNHVLDHPEDNNKETLTKVLLETVYR